MLSRKFWLGASIWDPASLVAQTVKRLPAVQETWVQSLGWEDPLEKEMATHSSTLAWKIPRTEEPGRLQSLGSQRVRHDWTNSLSFLKKTSMSSCLIHLSNMCFQCPWTFSYNSHYASIFLITVFFIRLQEALWGQSCNFLVHLENLLALNK